MAAALIVALAQRYAGADRRLEIERRRFGRGQPRHGRGLQARTEAQKPGGGQRGLGGDNSWGAVPHEEFRLNAWPIAYSYRLKVLHGGEDPVALAKQSVE